MNKDRRIAVVISSFSGFLENEINQEKDIFLTPLQLFIDNDHWLEGHYSLDEKYKIVEKFKNAKDFKTSLTPIGILEEQINNLSKNYDEVVYIPINSTLSSSHDSIVNLSKKFKNVHVFNNKLVGTAYLIVAKEIKRRYEEDNQSIEDIMNFLKWYNDRTIGYIIPLNLDTFIKSGRLKGIKKKIMTSLKLFPIIEVESVINNCGIGKTKKNAASKIMDKINKFIEKWNMKPEDFIYSSIKAYDDEIMNIINESLKEHFKIKPHYNLEASLVTMLHTGYGAAYIGINPKIELAPKFSKK